MMEQWLTIGRLAHATGVSAEQQSPPEPQTSARGEKTMSTPRRLESLTVLSTTTCCRDGSCGCGCGLSLVQLSPPQASERPAAGKDRVGELVCGDKHQAEAQ